MHISPRGQIFFLSGLILFLELALIRYLPANISYLGYYSNFILLASFVGMGIGMLLARKEYDLEKLFPWLLLITVGGASIFTVSVYPDQEGEIHFTSNFRGLVIPEFILVPVIFLLVTATFITISQRLGRLFTQLPPLTAYRWDILGGLTGITLFTLASYWQLKPVIWFAVVGVIFIFLNYKKNLFLKTNWVALILLLFIINFAALNTTWSPYQKLQLQPVPGTNDTFLYANNIGHQRLEPHQELPPVYQLPYTLFTNTPPYQHALIIGSGTGNDVAMAVAQGVKKITAVEIDPAIVKLGKKFHPDHPYNHPRVTVYIDDARSFLRRTTETYDLIIFALPDSVLLASGRGNIRLESFLFTREALNDARNHLTEDGLLVMYNYYRQSWLIDKLGGMLKEIFGQPPYILNGGAAQAHLAILMAGERLNKLSSQAAPSIKLSSVPPPATDNWPFLYLKSPSLPWIYIIMLTIIAVLIYSAISMVMGRSLWQRLELRYFLLGIAFMLLETTALVRFALLFGTTWLVNSLVFFAILTLVFLAITVAAKLSHHSLPWWYVGLGVILIIQYTLPLEELLRLAPAIKYLTVSLLTLLPIFFANIIFSLTFKNSIANDINFASNILGAALGGVLEYTALITGYRYLIIVIIICYALTFWLINNKKSGRAVTPPN